MKRIDLLSYLSARAFLHPEDTSNGAVTVTEDWRRNENYRVVNSAGRSYFVKRAGDTSSRSIEQESMAYEMLANREGTRDRRRADFDLPLFRHIPRCYGFDAKEQILVLELFPAAEDLLAYQERLRRFP